MTAANNVKVLNGYLDYALNIQGLSRETVYKYGLSMRGFLAHLGETPLTSATADDLRTWAHAPLRSGAAASPAYVKHKIADLRSLWNWMVDVAELTRTHPARKLHVPAVHNEEPKPVSDETWKALWGSDLELNDRVAFGIAFFCGLRRHEVTLLRPTNFVATPKPRIANFKRKGGKKMTLPYASCARFFEARRPDLVGGDASSFLDPLHELLAMRAVDAPLLAWREQQRAQPVYVVHPLPTNTINPGYFNKRLWEACDAAGVDRISPHQLRHGFGTNMVQMGMPLLEVSRLLGHSSVTVTQRYVATLEDPFDAYLDSGAPPESVRIPSPYG